MDKIYKINDFTKRGTVPCMVIGDEYRTMTVDGYERVFLGGVIYKFEVTDENATQESYDGNVIIPLNEFEEHFMSEEDNFARLEKDLEEGSSSIGGKQNIYAVYLSPYRYRVFVNAYPIKNDNGEWVYPKEGIEKDKPMFSFDIGAFGGCSIIDNHPDSPVLLGLSPKVQDWRDNQVKYIVEHKNHSEISKLECKLYNDLTFKDYLKCVKRRWHKRFHIYHGKDKRMSLTKFCFGIYTEFEFVRNLDKSRYGFVFSNEKVVVFFDIKHDGKWKPWFYKKKQDWTSCSI